MMYKKERPGYLLGGLLTKTIKAAYKAYRKKGGRKTIDRFKKRLEDYKKQKAEIPSDDMKTILKLKSKQDVRKGIRSQLPGKRQRKTIDTGILGGKQQVYKSTPSRKLLSKSSKKGMPKLLGAIGREYSRNKAKTKDVKRKPNFKGGLIRKPRLAKRGF
tara:strand:- start:451 stop:927 length:477 start_codon:yes stop_codon:yes gene_type:complete